MELIEIIGHILGIVGVCVIFSSYQFKEKKTIVLAQTVGTAFICAQYLLIGAYSGFALNCVCMLRNAAFYYKDKMKALGKTMPFIFAAAIVVVSLFFWDGWFSVFMVVGLAINTLCLGLCSPQGLRASLPFTCILVMIYNFFTGSIAGIMNEGLSIVSAVVGLLRYRRKAENK